MARVAGNTEMAVPVMAVQAGGKVFPILLPVDLPEGGFLHVTGGANALLPANTKMPIPRGCLVGVMAPEAVAGILDQIKPAGYEPRPGDPAPIPCQPFALGELPFEAPLYLPEGGFLNVVVGENPNALPIPSLGLPPGSLVIAFRQDVSAPLRKGMEDAAKTAANPYAIVPGQNGRPL